MQKLVDHYQEAVKVKLQAGTVFGQFGDKLLPVEVALWKQQTYQSKCEGVQDVIHALTVIESAAEGNDVLTDGCDRLLVVCALSNRSRLYCAIL